MNGRSSAGWVRVGASAMVRRASPTPSSLPRAGARDAQSQHGICRAGRRVLRARLGHHQPATRGEHGTKMPELITARRTKKKRGVVAATHSRACVHGQDAPRRRPDSHQPEREVDPAGQAKRTLVSSDAAASIKGCSHSHSNHSSTPRTESQHACPRSQTGHARAQAAGTAQGGTGRAQRVHGRASPTSERQTSVSQTPSLGQTPPLGLGICLRIPEDQSWSARPRLWDLPPQRLGISIGVQPQLEPATTETPLVPSHARLEKQLPAALRHVRGRDSRR